jgi:glutamine amidotransferase-like uncharacterized protein
MKLNKLNAVWAFALAIAVIGFVAPKFAIAQEIASSGILLFNGTGTSADVGALESVITNNLKLNYDTANSAQLDAMTQADLAKYKLLIIAGGNSITIGNNFSTSTMANIKAAVRENGLHYLGVCAGAFLASYAGSSGYNDIDLLDGIWFDMFTDDPCDPAAELLSRPGTQGSIDVYWQDGPQLTTQGGTWGTIVARYPNGQPAIIQGLAGNGWTLLQGVHPEAPASWRSDTFNTFSTSLSTDLAYSATLISAALNGTVLRHF